MNGGDSGIDKGFWPCVLQRCWSYKRGIVRVLLILKFGLTKL